MAHVAPELSLAVLGRFSLGHAGGESFVWGAEPRDAK